MSVQVIYKNKAKLSGLGVIALFGDEKFQIKNLGVSFPKKEASYIEKILMEGSIKAREFSVKNIKKIRSAIGIRHLS